MLCVFTDGRSLARISDIFSSQDISASTKVRRCAKFREAFQSLFSLGIHRRDRKLGSVVWDRLSKHVNIIDFGIADDTEQGEPMKKWDEQSLGLWSLSEDSKCHRF